MREKHKFREYEIELKYVGKGKIPKYVETDYGFGMNPPIVVRATSRANAIKQLKLPSTVKVARTRSFPIIVSKYKKKEVRKGKIAARVRK